MLPPKKFLTGLRRVYVGVSFSRFLGRKYVQRFPFRNLSVRRLRPIEYTHSRF